MKDITYRERRLSDSLDMREEPWEKIFREAKVRFKILIEREIYII